MTDEEREAIRQYVSWAEFQEMKAQVRDMHIAMIGNEYQKGFFDQFHEYQKKTEAELAKCQVECNKRRSSYWREVSNLKIKLIALIMILVGLGIVSVKEAFLP